MGDWDLSANAWLAVLEELKEHDIFRGIFDPNRVNMEFMNGICRVMATIAYYAGDKVFVEFCNEVDANIEESMRKGASNEDCWNKN